MTRPTEHKALVDAIIDQEIDAARLAKDAAAAAPDLATRQLALAKRILALRQSGKINADEGRRLFKEGFASLVLGAYAEVVGQVKDSVDEHLPKQVAEIKKLDKPLREVGPIRNADIKARALEKAGATDPSGGIKTS